MDRTWVLIADSHRARLFERLANVHALVELADFVFPSTDAMGNGQDHCVEGARSKGHGRTGHAGTQFEPHTDRQAQDRRVFSQLLAAHLNEGVASYQCSVLVLIAPGVMLGELRPRLSVRAGQALRQTVVTDFTHYTGRELEDRVDKVLEFLH
jgi:protein required for attachment to host cells